MNKTTQKSKFLKHLQLIMKVSFLWLILSIIGLASLVASEVKGQKLRDIRVTLPASETTLAKLFEAIENQSDYVFSYIPEIGLRPYQASDGKTTDLEAVLTRLAGTHRLKAEVFNRMIAISDLPPPQKPGWITGRVTDEKGMPLAGATIRVMGRNITAVCDENGDFSVRINPGSYTLSVNYISYQTQQQADIVVDEGDTVTINFELLEDIDALEEVVVVGYGTQRKSDITGAVSSVPRDRLDMVPNLNIGQVLQGSVPGVVYMQSQGGAAPSGEIMIRGRNSILASNAPLIILDGVPFNGNLMDINVNDVASIDVLKDASSAAIYGSRGANGVILITTKKGLAGSATITYDGKYAHQQPNRMPRYLSATEFYDFKETREPGNVTASEQTLYDSGSWTDWAELAIRNGSSNQHNLSVSGASERVNYFLSGNYLHVNGQTVNNSFERITGRANVQAKVNDWLTIGTNTQYLYDDRGEAPIDWSAIYAINPLTSAYDETGELAVFPWPEFIDIANPLSPLNYDYFDRSFQLVANNFAQVDFPFITGLSYRLNSGISHRLDDMGVYRGRNTSEGITENGSAETNRGVSNNMLVENILNYKKDFGKHSIFATALYSFQQDKSTANRLEASGFPNDFLGWYAVGQADLVVPGYDYGKTVLISQMLRFNYAYDNRYLITLTGRRDGYSGFGADNKWGLFPSVAVGWNIHRESFFNDVPGIDELKLRLSYGTNGNQAVSAYESISRLGEQNGVIGNTSLPGYVPTKIGQGDLGWETSNVFNAGLDYSLGKGRFSGSLNLYNTQTFDLLLNRTISPVHGITAITQNIGKTNNKGIEASLHASLIRKPEFSWSIAANAAFNRNKIVSLYGELDGAGNEIDDLANAWFIGKPILVNYNLKFNGVWQLDETEEAAVWDAEPGYAKIVDVDGDRARTEADRMVIGQLDPQATWGMTSMWNYKGVGLSVFMHGVHGITKENRLLQDASASSGVRRNVIKKNWWTPENPTNDFYKNAPEVQAVTLYENASFIRIKDITLSYDFGGKANQLLGLSRLRIYAVGRNLFTFTQWTASDPELNFGRGSAPLAKEFVLGLNFDF